MNAAHIALLLGAGFAAGAVNAVAGGGSLVTFPALLSTGLSQIAANVTNSVAVSPGYVASVYGSRTDLAELAAAQRRVLLLRLLPTTIAGAVAGCVLLRVTPPSAFAWIVPFLVLGAAVVLAFQDRLRGVVGHPRDMTPRGRAVALHVTVGLAATYGGYFGAALGVMLVASLGLVIDEGLKRINALKNAISAVVGLVTVVAFALFFPVNWADVALLAPATMAGGYLGARLARRLPPLVLRTVIVSLGLVVGVVLLFKALG
jgi:uncharacterized membrane protein YfcA